MKEKYIHKIFVVGLFLKGINGALEILGGIALLFTGALSGLLLFLIQKELIEDPTDFVANHLLSAVPYISSHSQFFAATYLLTHGAIKIFLFINLIRDRLWAYPAAILFLTLFIIYQVYRIFVAPTPFMVLLTIFDIFLIALTYHEYKIVKGHLQSF